MYIASEETVWLTASPIKITLPDTYVSRGFTVWTAQREVFVMFYTANDE